MQEAKATARATVRIGYDGAVHKFFHAANAKERFENELRVLNYLEQRGCGFVPRVLGYDHDKLELVTSNCGARVQQISDEKIKSLFDELETFGVRHDDPYLRNITYRASDGRFCVIDFEFATILDEQAAQAAQTALGGVDEGSVQAAGTAAWQIRWSGTSDQGRYRPNNEDKFLAVAFNRMDFVYMTRHGECPVGEFDYVFAVSDGMGGERSGEFASKFTVDNITRLMPRRYSMATGNKRSGILDCMDELFVGIHHQLTTLGRSYDVGRNMGSTLSMIWYIEGRVFFGHIGDSRIYHLPKAGGIVQVTEDHTHVGWLRRQGKLNEREARNHPRKNVLSQSLGSGNQYINPQLGEIRCQAGDRFLLCTDGVVEGLWDRGLEELIREPPNHLAALLPADRVVQTAIQESGRDNASALVVELFQPLSAPAVSEA